MERKPVDGQSESSVTQPASHAEPAIERYRRLLKESDDAISELRAKDARFGTARLILFAGALITLLFAFFSGAGTIAWVIGWALFASFFIAAILNEPVREEMGRKARAAEVTKRLIARLERDWDALAWPAAEKKLGTVQLDEHQKDVADDLDLLGRSSLYQMVSMAGTTIGVRTLARWLTSGADQDTATARQHAVETLAPLRDERARFYSLAAHVGEGTGDPDEFLAWAKSDSWLAKNGWLLMWAKLSSVLAVGLFGLLIASRFGVMAPETARILLFATIGLAVVNMIISSVMLGPAHQIFSVAMASRDSVQEYQDLFASAEWLESDKNEATDSDDRLAHLIEVALSHPTHSARAGMNALQKVASLGGLRSSAATFLLYLPLQAFGLWDVRVLQRLEEWQSNFGEHVEGWFEALGELEALMSLAAVCDENPEWVFPQWDAQATKLESVQVGHPLLRDGDRVCNDVTVGPTGTVLLVTGSNMSGKSTMLRSVGLNVSLAGAGAPVCAKSFRLPSMELATSIRVRDNLAEGVSFYMAELHRLKGVVDHARRLQNDPERITLFLLDEILQGTNSRERQIAVTQVLRHLIDYGAIGAISTHDLELADEPELMAVAETVHFRETIRPDADGNEQMTFDYQMRSGVSPTTNALRLLEIVGLGKAD